MNKYIAILDIQETIEAPDPISAKKLAKIRLSRRLDEIIISDSKHVYDEDGKPI